MVELYKGRQTQPHSKNGEREETETGTRNLSGQTAQAEMLGYISHEGAEISKNEASSHTTETNTPKRTRPTSADEAAVRTGLSFIVDGNAECSGLFRKQCGRSI